MSPISAGVRRGGSPRGGTVARSCAAPASSMSMPSASRNRMVTDCGSSGTRRTVNPPWARMERTWKRVTGTVAASRSLTLTPAALRPTINARLRARAARLESREATTVRSLLECRGEAIATRTRQLRRDVDVGQTRDPGPSEKVSGAPRFPHDRRVDDRAGFHRLERVDLDAGVEHGMLADEALVPEHHALLASGRRGAGRRIVPTTAPRSRTPGPR